MNEFTKLGIGEALGEALGGRGWQEPTEIQRLAVPKILAGASLVGQAPTGTGKTLAYLLPLLARIEPELAKAQAVVLAPTYELAMQIARTAQQLVDESGLPVRVQGLIGGANIARQIERLKKKPQLIVGSAGRILELSRKGKLPLAAVRALVLDEFDRLLDEQNVQATADVIRALPQGTAVQYLMFSATLPKKALERADFLRHPEVIRVKSSPGGEEKRENFYVIAPFRDKIEMLRKLARNLPIRRGLVFINRTFDAERTLAKLRYEGLRAESLLGNAGKMARKNAIMAFAGGKAQLLLSTDLAARGLDIEGIDYVINLDLPESADVYLHRAGRTARAGAAGAVITLADIREAQKLEALEKKLGIRLLPLKQAEPQPKRAAGSPGRQGGKPHRRREPRRK